MKRHILSLGILVFAALFMVFPATSHAVPELSESMSQGDFALWLVNAIGAQAKLPPAATAEDAINFLTDLGIVPEAGWQKDEPISMDFLADLLGDPEAASLSFEELIEKLRDYVQAIFDERSRGVFPAAGSGSGSIPA